MGGDEFRAIEAFRSSIKKDAKIFNIDKGTEDIMEDWTDVLNKWFKMVEALKVPGRKAKSKFSFWLTPLLIRLRSKRHPYHVLQEKRDSRY
jgi:hypothetical protein